MEEQQQLAKHNVIPIALFDLSQNLPRISDRATNQTAPVLEPSEANRQEQGGKPTQSASEAKMNQDQKDQVRSCLTKYRAAMFGSEQFAILTKLSKILPEFRGIQNDEFNSMELSGDGEGRIWTLSEIEEYINKN